MTRASLGHGKICETCMLTTRTSKSQYETRLKKWGFRKYSNRDDWLAVSSMLDTRRLQGKESSVLFDGKPIHKNRVRKGTQRYLKHKGNSTNYKGALRYFSLSEATAIRSLVRYNMFTPRFCFSFAVDSVAFRLPEFLPCRIPSI
jgi:hypothetical protein